MISIERNPQNYNFDATVSYTSIDGKVSTAVFTFKYLDEKARQTVSTTDNDFFKAVVVGWKDINFSDGTPFIFTPENVELILSNELLRVAVLSTYSIEVQEAIARNLKKSS